VECKHSRSKVAQFININVGNSLLVKTVQFHFNHIRYLSIVTERKVTFLQTKVKHIHTHIHTHPFNGPFSGTTRVSRYQKGQTNLDFTEARDSEWQWHQLGHMQVCTSFQTDNHATTPPLSFLQAGCPSWHSTNSVKALKAISKTH